MLICENLHNTINTNERPTARFILYMAARKINATKIRFPKIVSNKVTKSPGTANITIHNTTNNVINPTTRLIFLRENMLSNDKPILYIILVKKLIVKHLKRTNII